METWARFRDGANTVPVEAKLVRDTYIVVTFRFDNPEKLSLRPPGTTGSRWALHPGKGRGLPG
jgi:hypothetical protein